jgi:hypothetical protein
MATNFDPHVPSINSSTKWRFINPQGTPDFEVEHTDKRTVDASGTLNVQKVVTKQRLACGDIGDPHASCSECEKEAAKAKDQRCTYMCKSHQYLCQDCGQVLCPRHAKPIPEGKDEKARLCEACLAARNYGHFFGYLRDLIKSLFS